jgi:pimeloyl-[acyl-carrier protein] synthase
MTAAAAEPQDRLAARLYQRIEDMPPVFRTKSGAWVVSGHPEALQVLTSRTATSDDRAALPRLRSSWDDLARRFFIFADGADHARLRRLVGHAFTNRRLSAVSDMVGRIVHEELDRVRRTDSGELRFEVMSTLAFPVASRMIADLLGLPASAAGRLAAWGHALSGGLAGAAGTTRFDRAADEIQQFLLEQTRHPEPGSLLEELQEEHDKDRLGTDEVVATAALLLVAGFETSANFFGNLLLGLLWHRERYTELVRCADLTTSAVEELLRLFTPAHIVFRKVVAPCPAGDELLPAGSRVAVLLRACNRDPRVFADPAAYDPRRRPNPHLTFSHGVHYCLGAGLARLEAAAMLRALADFAPDLHLADRDGARWESRLLGRGLSRLDVVLG